MNRRTKRSLLIIQQQHRDKPDSQNTAHQKHMKIHMIGLEEFKEQYFRNHIDI